MHVAGSLCAIGSNRIVSVAVDDGLHLCMGSRARAAETHPNGKGVRELGDGRVEGTVGSLRIVVVVGASGRHATGIHASVRQGAVSGHAQNGFGVNTHAFGSRASITTMRRLCNLA